MALYSGYPDVSVSPLSSATASVSKARSTAPSVSRTTSACRAMGLSAWCAVSHCIASDGCTIMGAASLSSTGSG